MLGYLLNLVIMTKKAPRLFEQFKPKSYDLDLNFSEDKKTIDGHIVIKGLKTGRPSERITLHQKSLVIKSAKIIKHDKKGETEIAVSRINKQESANELRLHSDGLLYPGEYTISIDFTAPVQTEMHGVYECNYNHDGIAKKIIMTQFESHYSREAFPCIDEPEAKAIYNLTLTTPAGETVLSNTPIKKQKEEGQSLVTTFETTPSMSSYLLAFVFGEMHSVSGQTKDGITVNSWATVAQPVSHLEFGNNEAIKYLEFFTDYFKVPFPLKKFDQVAVPEFEALAMENWGLVTFREVGLLADPRNRSLSGEQLISSVIAHELSHQWFGNLVTMKWWDDLWLNESFASIMENIAPDALHPDWNQWEDFATSRVLSCSHRDIYKDVQAIGVEVNQPDDILTIFDPSIVYAKGARVLNMLFDFIGEDAFRSGLQAYFKEHAFGSTTRHDLWKSFNAFTDEDIDSLMTPWITQSGQPLLSVKRDEDKLRISQKRFLMDGEDNESLWPIPLLTDKELKTKLISKKSAMIDYPKNEELPIFNVGGSGHYITYYEDDETFDLLKSKIQDRALDSISRINILNDMLLLARYGKYELSTLLDVVAAGDQEPREAVWSLMFRIVSQAQSLTDGDLDVEKDIKQFKYKLAQYWYKRLGWDDGKDDDPNTKHLRTTALALTLSSDNKEAVDKAVNAYENLGSVEELPAEQRTMIAATIVKRGKQADIDKLMKEYETCDNPDVIQSITSALCASHDEKTIAKIIDWALGEKGIVRQQDIDHWFAYLMRNHYSRDQAWEWFVTSWDRLAKMFMGGKNMERFVWYSAGPVSTKDWEKKFKDFFEPKMSEPTLERNLKISFSEIAARIEWRDREESKLKAYFKSN
jgi:aminopeptidase N